MWSFFRNESDLATLLQSATTLNEEQKTEYLKRFPEALRRVEDLAPVEHSELDLKPASDEVLEYFNAFTKTPLHQKLLEAFPAVRLGYLPTSSLINPLALIDYELIEQLRATLEGDSELAIAKFAMPTEHSMPVRVALDPGGRSATFVSQRKTLTIVDLTKNQTAVGVEVKFVVSAAPEMIMVSYIAGRLYLRYGVHRAHLLASMGLQDIPCVVVEENQFPRLAGAYPAFPPIVLAQPRPPLLIDTFDTDLSLKVPLQRSQKVIRVHAEELVIPIE